MKIFVSHSSANATIAEKICGAIENSGHTCFYAPRDIRSGFEYAEEIINGIDSSQAMLLILSAESNSSPHVLREIERAVSRKIPIIVYKLEEVTLTKSMEYFLMSHQWLTAKKGGDYGEIINCINRFSDSETHSEAVTAAEASKNATNVGIRKAALVAVAVGLCIGCIAVAAYFISSCSDKTEQTDSTTTTQHAFASTSDTQTTTSTTEASITTTPDSTTTTTTASAAPTEASAELGATLTLGSYNGQPIEWRVIKLSDDGKQAVVVANDILTLKAFDAAESGEYNEYNGVDYWTDRDFASYDFEIHRNARGNNLWAESNIRTWLNSDKEAVYYSDTAPKSSAMSELKNGYETESGFLYGFTSEELSAIATTSVITNGVTSEDKVFLLSSDELEWIKTAGIKMSAVPTEQALEQDKSGWYTIYSVDFGVTDHYWWLRDNDGTTGCNVYLVTNSYTDYKIANKPAALEGFGIRPAMTVDLTSEIVRDNLK